MGNIFTFIELRFDLSKLKDGMYALRLHWELVDRAVHPFGFFQSRLDSLNHFL